MRDGITGRFVKGHSGNPKGTPKRVPGYLEAFKKAVTPAKWNKILKVIIEQAIAGDRYAYRTVLEYCIGKAPDTVDMHITGGMSLDVWLANAELRRKQAEEVLCED